MATTTNYGWETPDDTDLVKDGASAIRTLGSAIDTTVFNNASAGIAKTLIDAKGDLISATAADTPARLAVGADGTYLQADSTTSTGLKWGSISAGGMTLLTSGNLSGTSVSLTSISASYNDLRLILRDVVVSSTGEQTIVRFNSDSANNYGSVNINEGSTSLAGGGATSSLQQVIPDTGTADSTAVLDIYNYADTTAIKVGQYISHKDNGIVSPYVCWFSYHSTSAISSIQILVNGGVKTFTAGNYLLYGVK